MSRRRKDRKTKRETKGKYLRKCSECGFNIVTGNKEIYCDSCGLVIKENIVDLGPERRSYNSEQREKRIRTGPPMTYRIHDKGLSVFAIGNSSRIKGKRVEINTTNENNFIFALSQVELMSSALGLPENIRESASLLYRKAMRGELICGHSIEAITSAILYIVCRQYEVPRTFREIERASWAKKKKISKAAIFLTRELKLKFSPISPRDFVPRFCSLLELSAKTKIKALEIIKETSELNNNGQSPTGIAAAAIYMAVELNSQDCLQKEIAEITGVSGTTIRNRCKEISKQLGIDATKTEN